MTTTANATPPAEPPATTTATTTATASVEAPPPEPDLTSWGGDEAVIHGVDPAELPSRKRRRWGIGSLLIGGGVSRATLLGEPVQGYNRKLGPIPALLLPTVEVQAFRRNGHSIDISVPLTNLIVSAVITEIYLYTTDVFYSFNNGHGRIRQIIGPGLGVGFGGARGVAVLSARVPIELGVEALTRRLRWGFKAIARPFFEVDTAAGGGARITALGGGVLAGIGVSRYGVTR